MVGSSEHTDREQLRDDIHDLIRERVFGEEYAATDAILELIDRRLGVPGSEHTRADSVRLG